MKFYIRIFFLSIISATPVATYYINPFNLPTENIRPRISGHDIYRIPSKSMLPTLAPGDYIIISNIAYSKASPKKGDIIVFNRISKKDNNQLTPYIKRVIATAGDTFLIKNGTVLINHNPLQEDYIDPKNVKRAYSQFQPERTIPKGMIFVLGDNRDNSADSRIFGFVAINDVIGQATTLISGEKEQFWKRLDTKSEDNKTNTSNPL